MKIHVILAVIGIGIIIGIMLVYSLELNSITIQDDVTSRGDVSIQSQTPAEYDEIIIVGTINRDAVKMTKRYQPFIDYVAEKLSDEDTTYKGIVQISSSEQDMINLVKNQKMDIYFDSPLIGMKIANETDMNPLLLSWKEGHKEYHTVFIVPLESDVTFDNLKNKTVIFEDEESTSGYLLPLSHLQNSGYIIDHESSESLLFDFSLDDENTPIWILEGRGDIGATSNLDFENTPLNIKEKLKVIESTKSIPRQIIFLGNHIEYQDELKKILLEMNDDIEALKILEKISRTSKISEIDQENDLNQIKNILELLK